MADHDPFLPNPYGLPAPPSGVNRRAFLAMVVAGAATVAVGCSGSDEAASPGTTASTASTTTAPDIPVPDVPEPFTLGVASGDPTDTAVILWTRLAPEPMAIDGAGGMPAQPAPVGWEMATDEAFTDIVASGTAVAEPALGHSVHVDATRLSPATDHWYRFTMGEHTSPVGRTRTLPEPGTDVDRFAFAFASCQDWEDGYWTAYPGLVDEDIDAVVFLGDYIYESGPDPTKVRQHVGEEVKDLAGYRNRYGQYKSDSNLQAAHARFPWIVTWDDHEVDNDYADDAHDGGDPPETFLARRAAAYQAYYEHMPLRIDPPDGADLVVYRSVEIGTLATMFVLDTRQYRDDQACKAEEIGGTASPLCDEATSPDRTILGTEQREWLTAGLTSNTARWNILANQVVFSKLPILGELFNMDQWDGYSADRDIVLEAMSAAAAPTIVVTGDIHLAGAATVRQDFADESSTPLGVEFVGTSISSSFGEELYPFVDAIAAEVPWIEYVNPRSRGYCVVTLTPDEARADYRIVASITEPTSTISTDRSFTVAHDDPRLVEA